MTWTEFTAYHEDLTYKYVYVPLGEAEAIEWFDWAVGDLEPRPYDAEPYFVHTGDTLSALTEPLRHRGHGYRTRGYTQAYQPVSDFVAEPDVKVVTDLENPLEWEVEG